jgi:hypothetical protein
MYKEEERVMRSSVRCECECELSLNGSSDHYSKGYSESD